MRIDRETPFVTEDEPHKFGVFASDLELKPGEWPVSFETNLGNGQPFHARYKEIRNGDLLWVTYHQVWGCIQLRVFND